MAYNPDFTRNSKGQFNLDNGYVSVKNGSEAYLLEDELNEMQWIQNEQRAQSMRSLLSSGFLYKTLDILDSNSNINESIYVKGYGNTDLATNAILFNIKEYIPVNINGYFLKLAGTYNKTITGAVTTNNNLLVNLPAPPASSPRYDLVYLEAWFEEISVGNSDVKYNGGVDNSNVSTFANDPRLNVETTHRIQLKWDIVVVPGAQYLTDAAVKPRGLATNTNYVAANSCLDKPFSKDANLYVSLNNVDGVMDKTYYALPIMSIYRTAGQTTISAANCLSQVSLAHLFTSTFFGDKIILGLNDGHDIVIQNQAGSLEVHDITGQFVDITGNDIIISDNISPTHNVVLHNNVGALEVRNSSTSTGFADLVIGNLTVKGTTTTINSETMTVADNIIVLNSNVTSGTPTENAGIQISRGSSTSASLIWNESADGWEAGLTGSENLILTEESPVIIDHLTINSADTNKIVLQTTSATNTQYIAVNNSSGTLVSKLGYNTDRWYVDSYKLATINASNNIIDTAGNAANAATASKLKTPITINIGGAVNGSSSFDGSANITITTTMTSGLDASKPAATGSKTLYICTDTRKVYFDNSTWQSVGHPDGVDEADPNFHYDSVAPTGSTRLNYNGYFYATRTYNAVFNDYAEYFAKGETLEPGDVVACDPNTDKYVKATFENRNLVVGVYSDTFGQCLGGNGNEDDEENFAPIGLAGRVNVKVIGNVKKGDLLTCSSIPGVATVASEYIPGTIIGKALQNHFGETVNRISMLIQNM